MLIRVMRNSKRSVCAVSHITCTQTLLQRPKNSKLLREEFWVLPLHGTTDNLTLLHRAPTVGPITRKGKSPPRGPFRASASHHFGLFG